MQCNRCILLESGQSVNFGVMPFGAKLQPGPRNQSSRSRCFINFHARTHRHSRVPRRESQSRTSGAHAGKLRCRFRAHTKSGRSSISVAKSAGNSTRGDALSPPGAAEPVAHFSVAILHKGINVARHICHDRNRASHNRRISAQALPACRGIAAMVAGSAGINAALWMDSASHSSRERSEYHCHQPHVIGFRLPCLSSQRHAVIGIKSSNRRLHVRHLIYCTRTMNGEGTAIRPLPCEPNFSVQSLVHTGAIVRHTTMSHRSGGCIEREPV